MAQKVLVTGSSEMNSLRRSHGGLVAAAIALAMAQPPCLAIERLLAGCGSCGKFYYSNHKQIKKVCNLKYSKTPPEYKNLSQYQKLLCQKPY